MSTHKRPEVAAEEVIGGSESHGSFLETTFVFEDGAPFLGIRDRFATARNPGRR
jgi:hypothetical protein